MKRFIKTLKELRATEGVVEENGRFRMHNVGTSFNRQMNEMSGEELISPFANNGNNITQAGWRFSPWMWKEVEDTPAEGLEFPCDMLVWDNDENPAYALSVHAHVPTLDFPWVAQNESETIGFKHAKPIPEFKPRFVWVDDRSSIAAEISEGVYISLGSKTRFTASDFVNIGPEITPTDLQT